MCARCDPLGLLWSPPALAVHWACCGPCRHQRSTRCRRAAACPCLAGSLSPTAFLDDAILIEKYMDEYKVGGCLLVSSARRRPHNEMVARHTFSSDGVVASCCLRPAWARAAAWLVPVRLLLQPALPSAPGLCPAAAAACCCCLLHTPLCSLVPSSHRRTSFYPHHRHTFFPPARAPTTWISRTSPPEAPSASTSTPTGRATASGLTTGSTF